MSETKWKQFVQLFSEKNPHLTREQVLQQANKPFQQLLQYYQKGGANYPIAVIDHRNGNITRVTVPGDYGINDVLREAGIGGPIKIFLNGMEVRRQECCVEDMIGLNNVSESVMDIHSQ